MNQGVTSFLRTAVLGASQGLGRAILGHLADSEGSRTLAVARRLEDVPPSVETFSCDLVQVERRRELIVRLRDFSPSAIFYCAGGGPYGPFGKKEWKDHQWAFDLNLLAPAEICHAAVRGDLPSVSQIVLVGSAVAEADSDLGACSYSTAKHGLVGLFKNLIEESTDIDFRLYSPGYMDTKMLPPGATVRQRSIWNPRDVAEDLLKWVRSAERNSHRRLALYP